MRKIFYLLFIMITFNNFLFTQENTTDKIDFPKKNKFLFNTNIMPSLPYKTVKGLNREWSKTLMV